MTENKRPGVKHSKDELAAMYAEAVEEGKTKLTEAEWTAMFIMDNAMAQPVDKPAGKGTGKPASLPKAAVKKKPAAKAVSKSAAPPKSDQTVKEKQKPVEDTAPDQPLLDDKGKSTLPPMVRINVDVDPPMPPAPEKVDDIAVLASGLTAKQELFAREWVADRDRNGTQAAIRAGYAVGSAHVAASRLLSNDKVRAFIAALVAPHFAKLDITAEELLQEYANMARVNNYDFVQKDEAGLVKTDANGLPIPDFANLTRAQMAGLAGMEIVILPSIGEDEPNPIKVKWKLGDKKGAMDVLAKRMGVLKEHVEHSGEVTIKGDAKDLAMRIAFALRQAEARGKNGA